MLPPILRKLMTLSDNRALPEISAWRVKSFWLQLLLIATIALNYLGIDLMAELGEMGLGRTPDEVVATGARAVNAFQEVILPIILGVWMWLERRAPQFRLRLLPRLGRVDDPRNAAPRAQKPAAAAPNVTLSVKMDEAVATVLKKKRATAPLPRR